MIFPGQGLGGHPLHGRSFHAAGGHQTRRQEAGSRRPRPSMAGTRSCFRIRRPISISTHGTTEARAISPGSAGREPMPGQPIRWLRPLNSSTTCIQNSWRSMVRFATSWLSSSASRREAAYGIRYWTIPNPTRKCRLPRVLAPRWCSTTILCTPPPRRARYAGLMTNIDAKGGVRNVSAGTAVLASREDYRRVPNKRLQGWGQGLALAFLSALLERAKSGKYDPKLTGSKELKS